MGVFTAVSLDEARALVRAYDVGELAAIHGIAAGSVNSNCALEVTGGPRGPRVFLRVYEEQDDAGAHAEADLLAHLAARGVHTPAPILARDGARIATVVGKPAALFPWAP